jgi:hypothetical protein
VKGSTTISDGEPVTPEQRRLLLNAPFAAATYVSLASGGMIDFVKEMAAASRFLCEQTPRGRYGALVDGLLAELQGMSRARAKELEFYYGSGDPAAIREEARRVVAEAAAVLATVQAPHPLTPAVLATVQAPHPLTPAAVDGYRQWLMAAVHTAALAGTGTLIPGSSRAEIDVHEEAAIAELAGILLGVRPSPAAEPPPLPSPDQG